MVSLLTFYLPHVCLPAQALLNRPDGYGPSTSTAKSGDAGLQWLVVCKETSVAMVLRTKKHLTSEQCRGDWLDDPYLSFPIPARLAISRSGRQADDVFVAFLFAFLLGDKFGQALRTAELVGLSARHLGLPGAG